MKLQYYIFLIFCITIVGCNNQDGTEGLSYHSKTVVIELPDSVNSSLENGDIIIRKGDGPLSFHLTRTTGEAYTHCGIIFKSKSNGWGVIHTLGSDASSLDIDGVQIQSLKGFVRQSADSTLFICRPVFKNNIGDSIVLAARKYLDEKIPFDYGFSMLSTNKFYCTELLYYVFKDVNDGKNVFDLKLKNKSYILLFSTFFNTENFRPVFKLKSN